ncbi:MAG: hypothetical protein HN404_16490 [Gemmatimonadetes bacterium]|jgi:hypothetical protein|nr:hypothetical protein [Gemmatimonadota bacterium]
MSSKVKEAIEEMIEESYLLGLSEQEVRQDFKRFIDTCYTVIQKNVKDRQAVSHLAESLAREQTVILIADRADADRASAAEVADPPAGIELDGEIEAQDEDRAAQEFSEKVARRKRQILRTIADVDPRLVRLIDEQRFQGESEEPQRPVFRAPRSTSASWRPDWSQWRVMLLKVGYATTVALIILLIWLGFMQKP